MSTLISYLKFSCTYIGVLYANKLLSKYGMKVEAKNKNKMKKKMMLNVLVIFHLNDFIPKNGRIQISDKWAFH